MELLDGWANAIGNASCRFFSRNGHDGLYGLICSDGAYSAGWKVFGSVLVVLLLAVWLMRVAKPN